ncbi:HNH endonuclease [Desulforamulus reducens MI-1]|uniref:HNH endonuclease n=1 Tax=Desulforamulus reducens (strain ATCC BAA-1160 / DSM 100696 / MI-1) TaxID=349161 RepID=A4J1W9_DESRM|nr:HNH endonuclease signature motif containing protein [Desulforamulus reducens]ABO49072.1 HNH endonuclease [Desulforamulus reducens MI-1]
MFESTAKNILSGISDTTKKVVNEAVDFIEEATRENKLTGAVREVGTSVIDVTNNTLHKVVEVADGSMDVVKGVVQGDDFTRDDGFCKIKDAVTETTEKIGSGIMLTFEAGGKTIKGLVESGSAALNGGDVQVGLDKAIDGATQITKTLAVGGLALGALDVLDLPTDDIDGFQEEAELPGGDASDIGIEQMADSKDVPHITHIVSDWSNPINTPHLFSVQDAEAADFAQEPISIDNLIAMPADPDGLTVELDYEPGEGLLPEVSVDEIEGVENGMASDEAFDQLIDIGCVEDTTHIEDPPRSDAAVRSFLNKYGYEQTPEGYEVHHIIPLSEGGADSPDNMVLVTEEMHDDITAAQRDYYGWGRDN